MRKLASIRKIVSLEPIEGADRIELALLDGWKAVVKKGEFTVDSLVVYCEIDSWIPHELAPFLTKPGKEPKEYLGVKGQKLKTVRLRGQLSQGLVLSIPENLEGLEEGTDVSEALGIVKWEPELDASLQGSPKGNFPSFLQKTNQERVQNLKRDIAKEFSKETVFEVTEKLDGSSMTVYLYDDYFGVCSRNIDLKEDDQNTYWKVARDLNLEAVLRNIGDGYALQGELVGPKIQGNPYKLNEFKFYLFDIYNIVEGSYLFARKRLELLEEHFQDTEVVNAPILGLEKLESCNVDNILLSAEGKSVLNSKTEREGLVYRSLADSNFSFKAISNKFLLG